MRPPRVVRRRRVTGSPPHRSVSRRGEGLPGYGAVLFVRAMVAHPAGYGPLLAHTTEKPLLPSGTSGPWASGKVRGFGAACPMAHTFACLRIADGLSATVARLATGRAGSPLAGQDSHLLDDTQSFMKALHPPVPIDPHCLVALIFLYSRQERAPLHHRCTLRLPCCIWFPTRPGVSGSSGAGHGV